MDTNTLLVILLVFVIFLLLVVIGGLVFYIYIQYTKSLNLKNNQNQVKSSDLKPESLNIKELLEEQKLQSEKTVGLCSICEKTLIESTHYEIDKLHFCKEHFDVYTKNEWVSITNQRTTAETPEAGVYIYNFKKQLWEKDKEPCYIQCEYKIDVTSNQIETYVQLHVLKEKADQLKTRLELR